MIRQSNFEFLRLLAMMMVLALHANYLSFGFPIFEDYRSNFITIFLRSLCEYLCLPAVDIFIFISGWFSIHSVEKGIASIAFQCVFFCSLIVLIIDNIIGVPVTDVIKQLYFGSDYWFVPAYLCIVALSPVLNTFSDHVTRSQFRNFLIVFFLIQTFYGWFFLDFANTIGGYSALSFVGIYLLARFLRLHGSSLMSFSACAYLLLFLSLGIFAATIQAMAAYFLGEFAFIQCQAKLMAYNNPFIILSAICLFLVFSKLSIQSSVINWLASSSFAIYLIHGNSLVLPYYEESVRWIWNKYPSIIGLVGILCFLLCVSLASILFDKIRILCWSFICSWMKFTNVRN